MAEEHPVEEKLRRTLVPYFVSGDRLKYVWPYAAYNVFAYTRDVSAGVAGLGVIPLLSWVSDSEPVSAIASALSQMPLGLRLPAMALAVSWVILRVALARNDVEKRAILANSFRLELRKLESSMYRALRTRDPMPVLLKIQEKVEALVDRSIPEDVYPWVQHYAPGIEREVERRMVEIGKRYKLNWIPAPEGGRAPQRSDNESKE